MHSDFVQTPRLPAFWDSNKARLRHLPVFGRMSAYSLSRRVMFFLGQLHRNFIGVHLPSRDHMHTCLAPFTQTLHAFTGLNNCAKGLLHTSPAF